MTRLPKCNTLGELPNPLGDMPALVVDGCFYIFGGGCGQEVCDDILTVDPQSGQCLHVGKMPYRSRGHQAVLLDDQIYLLGGFENGTKDELWRLHIKTGVAERLKSMPNSNAWFAAAAHGNTIVVVGGFSIPIGYLNQIFIYDPQTDDWSIQDNAFVSELFPKRQLGSNSIVSDGETLLSFGGADEFDSQRGRANALGLVCRYSLVHQSWESLLQQINPREGLVATRRDSHVYLVGGMSEAADTPSPIIEDFNLITGEIRELAKLRIGRLSPAVGIVNERLLVAGGVIEPLFGMTNTIEFLDLGDR